MWGSAGELRELQEMFLRRQQGQLMNLKLSKTLYLIEQAAWLVQKKREER
jgi:hypothetical protein